MGILGGGEGDGRLVVGEDDLGESRRGETEASPSDSRGGRKGVGALASVAVAVDALS